MPFLSRVEFYRAVSCIWNSRVSFLSLVLTKQVKQVYNDQLLGILALGKIGGGYGSLVSVVSVVPGYLEMVPGYPDVVPGYLSGVLWYLG